MQPQQEVITDEQAQFFLEQGLLVIRKVLRGAELAALQEQTARLIQRALTGRPEDYRYKQQMIFSS